MSRPFDPVAALRVLVEEGVRFIVIGQIAAVMHGHPEGTVDLDILVQQDLDNAERLVAALDRLGARRVGPGGRAFEGGVDERDFLGWTHIVETDTSAGPVDVIPYALGVGDYTQLINRASRMDVDGLEVPVAALQDVIASKEAAGRPKDISRLPSLRDFARRRAAGLDG